MFNSLIFENGERLMKPTMDLISEQLKSKDWSNSLWARKVGVGRVTIWNWKEKKHPIRESNIHAIARALKMDVIFNEDRTEIEFVPAKHPAPGSYVIRDAGAAKAIRDNGRRISALEAELSELKQALESWTRPPE